MSTGYSPAAVSPICPAPPSDSSVCRDALVIDALMAALPFAERRWCGMDRCECSGCANSLVSRDEWMAWFIRQKTAVCARCQHAMFRVDRTGQRQAACESCGTVWD